MKPPPAAPMEKPQYIIITSVSRLDLGEYSAESATATAEALNQRYVWGISLAAAMGALLFGYDWVVIGGAKPFYEPYFQIDSPARQGR